MKSAEEACCIVTVSESQYDQTRHPTPKPLSCSGAILNDRAGIVLCNGLIFSRFMKDKESISADHTFLLPASFSSKLQVCVHHPGLQDVNMNECAGEACVMDAASVSNQEAQLVLLINCLEFQRAFLQIFRKTDKWSFYGGEEDAALLRDSEFLSWFAVLRVRGLVKSTHGGTVPWVNSTALEKGCAVLACGSPFGSFCPDLFMSTLSKGIVSNLSGEDNAVILTDARCLPGTEGGGLFVQEGDAAYLVGLIVSPLCWKSSEWIGLTLVCSLQLILRNIIQSVNSHHPLREICVKSPTEILQIQPNENQRTTTKNYPTVALVDSGLFWGSGILLNPRLVLTCRHVVNGRSRLTVGLSTSDRFHTVLGEVLYSSKPSSPYDVAVVQLAEPLSNVIIPELANFFKPGEDVVVISYGALGQSCGPSVTSGILSRAITCHSQPVMLQTTCAVQAGASGGAVVRANTGELLGLVSSNTRDFAAKVTYPHLNFSIPVTVLEPLLQRFALTGDAAMFQALDTAEDGVRRVWRLQATQSKL